jgi:hypothetical protein
MADAAIEGMHEWQVAFPEASATASPLPPVPEVPSDYHAADTESDVETSAAVLTGPAESASTEDTQAV